MDLRTTRTITSAIEIRAPIETCWRVLTDFEEYEEWNPHIRRVRGRVRLGARIAIYSQPPGGRLIVMRPIVIAWDPPRQLRWRATFIHRWLFRGEHGFRLEQSGDARTRFVQDERFSGLLVPLYSRVRLGRTRLGFERVNEALRERAEARAQ